MELADLFGHFGRFLSLLHFHVVKVLAAHLPLRYRLQRSGKPVTVVVEVVEEVQLY